MEKLSYKFAVFFLAFSVGIAIAGVFYVRTLTEVAEVDEPIFDGPVNQTVIEGQALEMVFVLDTTGSMGGLLEGAKQRIWGIVNEVMQKQSRPRVRVGLVAYRDKDDAYVTKVLPLTDDLDKVYTTLMDYEAAGGGDTPEDVRRALADGVKNAGWSQAKQGIAQIIFLVGDAPPQSYENEPDVLATTSQAVKKNMIVNTIQCGDAVDTKKVWQQVAQYGQGKYFAIAQDGGVQTINTPYDEKLAELGNKIGQTYLAYGTGRVAAANMQAATEERMVAAANTPTRADRTLNKAINDRAYNDDLLQDVETGKTKLESVKSEDLPDDLRKMSESERKAEIEKRLAERKKIREEILNLSKQRDAFISAERKKSGKQNGFDAAVAEALSEQLARRGIK
jgi:hypothetical protein